MHQEFICVFLFLCLIEINSVITLDLIKQNAAQSTNNNTLTRQLGQPAPYAIDNAEGKEEKSAKNLLLRLAHNQTEQSRKTYGEEDSLTIVNTNNGTFVDGSKVNLDLNKLLAALSNTNITSQIKFDDTNGGSLNITFSNFRNSNKLDEYLLEELMFEARLPHNQNLTSTVKDNHRADSKYQSRSKSSLANLSVVITPPPIRNSVEIVAENYTVRKIADEANIFAVKLLHQLNLELLGSRNVIQSPFGVYQGLALLLSGAMGETSRELDRVLLGSQSAYENNRLTHDQDRARLLASLGDVVHQLQLSSSHHFKAPNDTDQILTNGAPYFGGTAEQHLLVANNLLFSPSAFEISNEFKNSLNVNYNHTALTKVEVGSTESVQTINNWIRRVTSGIIPAILNKRATFDEFNVMSLLSTSWLMQEWKDTFYKIPSQAKSNIRLRGQYGRDFFGFDEEALLEFVDDDKQSHFVEYVKSRPTKNIRHYHAILNGLMVDVVVVPFRDSNHRMITLTPLIPNNSSFNDLSSLNQTTGSATTEDQNLLSRFVSNIASNPRRALRSLWNIVAPDIITKQIYQNIQLAKVINVTIDDRVVETTITPPVQLSMPLIRTSADSSISPALNHIGIVNAFDPDQANFIGINGHPFNYYKLHLSNVISKTTFNLNEKGINYDRTIKSLSSMRIHPQIREQQEEKKEAEEVFVDEIKLNRPYIYMICDIRTKLILYTGIMRNPQQVTTL